MEQEELARDVEKERAKSWRRPEPPPHDPDTDTLVFQQIEIDFYIGKFGENIMTSLIKFALRPWTIPNTNCYLCLKHNGSSINGVTT